MEFSQKYNSPGLNNFLGSDIYEINYKRVGLLLNKVYLIKVPLLGNFFFDKRGVSLTVFEWKKISLRINVQDLNLVQDPY